MAKPINRIRQAVNKVLFDRHRGNQPATSQSPQSAIEERRQYPRYATKDPAEVVILREPFPTIACAVFDVSQSGLGLELPINVAVGSRIEVKLQEDIIIGEVRYCRPVGRQFQAGVLIRDIFRTDQRDDTHVGAAEIKLYLAGQGLTLPEVVQLRNHLSQCECCRRRLNEESKLLSSDTH